MTALMERLAHWLCNRLMNIRPIEHLDWELLNCNCTEEAISTGCTLHDHPTYTPRPKL